MAPVPNVQQGAGPGWYLYHNSQRYRIDNISDDNLNYHIVDIETGEVTALSIHKLLLDPEPEATTLFAPDLRTLNQRINEETPAPLTAYMAKVPESFLEKSNKIVEIMRMIDKNIEKARRQATLRNEKFSKTKMLKYFLRKLSTPIALSTYYKYRKLYDKWDGDIHAMAADMRRTSFRQSKLSKAAIHLTETLIMRWRHRSNPTSVGELYKRLCALLNAREGWWVNPDKFASDTPDNLIEELLDIDIPTGVILENPDNHPLLTNIPTPSRAWFYRYVRWYERFGDNGKSIFIEQHGRDAYEDQYMVFDSFVDQASYALQYVFFDHWLVDVFTVDEETRDHPYRLWATMAIDAYSRSILGVVILAEDPGTESVMQCLKHMIWPKTSHTELGIERDWVCWGIPNEIFMDNAWTHHSETVRAIGQKGQFNSITLSFRPPYKARFGALIERFFGNLSGRMKTRLVGAIPSSDPRAVGNAAKAASLLAKDVEWFIHDEIVNYQHTVHSELDGMTPHEKWLEGTRLMKPMAPTLTPSLERRFKRLHTQSRIISKDGVRYLGMNYWTDEMSGLSRKQGKTSVKYLVYYDVNDLHCISLFSVEEGIWVCDAYAKQLRKPDGSYRRVSLWERNVARKLAKKNGTSPRNWMEYLDEIDKLNLTRRSEKRKQKQASKRKKKNQLPNSNGISKTQIHQADAALEALDDEYDEELTDLLFDFAKHDDD